MASLSLRIVTRLRDFAVDVGLTAHAGGPAVALVGPSGAGKTTVLRCVAGLRRPEAGRIALGHAVWFDGQAGVDLPPEHRSVGLVPQHHALFPHLCVRDNVAFGARGIRPDDLLERLRIGHLARERPSRLSAGERQRVALARALARRPEVLLLDEPLGALDPHTRSGVRAELQRVLRDVGAPTLLVTHDWGDAVALAGRIAVLHAGMLHQEGTAEELLERPADPFVAAFTGANVLFGTAAGHDVRLDGGAVIRAARPARGRVAVAVHPWEIDVRDEPVPGRNAVPGVVESVVAAGPRARVRIAGLEAEAPAGRGPAPGRLAQAVFDVSATRILDQEVP